MKGKKQLTAFSVLMMFVLSVLMSGCSFNGGRSVKQYVETVREDMRSAVNISRELKKKDETLDCRNKETAKDYLDSLKQLEDLYAELSGLNAPDRYTDLDNDLKTWSEEALSNTAKLKMLVTTAMNTGDDTLLKQDHESIAADYDNAVSELVDISSQITTRYRND